MAILPVQQSGVVTPNHLAAFVTDGVVADAGVTLFSFVGVYSAISLGVNFNAANTDFPINILLPIGYSRYRVHDIIISGPTGTLVPATCAVFTGLGGGGIAVVNSTALTITTSLADQVNTMQVLPINNQNTIAWLDSVLYFRVGTPQGLAALANVTVNYEPLP